jgi:hypothetical protein
MKKLSILFAAFAVVMLASCGKYEDGPGFSLRSKASRIAGSWTIEKATSDGVDYTADLSGLTFEFTQAGSYTETFTFFGQTSTDTGNWELTSNNEDLTITYTDGTIQSYKILRLTNSELWFSETSSGTTDEYHLKAK